MYRFAFHPLISRSHTIWLGSDKDIEDAVYLWEIFKNNLDHNHMKNRMKDFAGVTGEEYMELSFDRTARKEERLAFVRNATMQPG